MRQVTGYLQRKMTEGREYPCGLVMQKYAPFVVVPTPEGAVSVPLAEAQKLPIEIRAVPEI